MKVVILAGGLGTRLAEETEIKPKPMVEIGERPIIWHIMKHFSYYGFNEFFIALGYKGNIIKKYFFDYLTLSGDITINNEGNIIRENQEHYNWKIHLVDTGLSTLTGGRVKRLQNKLEDTFIVTYGDGVSNIDLDKLVQFHKSHGKIATVTAVRPPARFGGLVFDGDLVLDFTEKPQAGEGWINGGYLVFEPQLFDYLNDDNSSLEADALEKLAHDKQLAAYRHYNFWQCMDTLRDKNYLESLWKNGERPWMMWE